MRLRYFTVDLPTAEARDAVLARLTAASIPYTDANGVVTLQDPWQNTILLQVGHASVDQAATYAQG
ncbi:MAG: hypothetical protein U0841_19085 [Chloroflexia bacterium]